MNVGFIGLGRMGKPMARNLINAGFSLVIHNRSQEVVQELAALGATAAGSPAEVAAACDVVLTCLPDVATVEEVYMGSNGLVTHLRLGQVLADHSTVGLSTSHAIAAAAKAKGAAFLDAPISGGVERASDASLTIMVGGDADAYAKASPVFQAMGTHLYHMGSTGAGTVTKLINQLLVCVHSAAAAEALVLAQAAGADVATVLEVLDASWGASNMLRRNGPVALDRTFAEARAPLRLLVKDLNLVCDLARQLGAPLPQGEQTLLLLSEAKRLGLLEQDVAAMVVPLEREAGVQVRRGMSA